MAVPLDIDEDKLRNELRELLEADQSDGGTGTKGRAGRDTTGERDGNSNEVALLGQGQLERIAEGDRGGEENDEGLEQLASGPEED